MIRIDIPMPERCADCPLIVKIPTMPGATPIYLFRAGWKQVDLKNVLKRREDWCPMVEIEEVE